jgi:hypothetical protein
MKFKVTAWQKDKCGNSTVIEAQDHKEALRKSGLLEPGQEFTVDGNRATIRYSADARGRLHELSRYSY